MAKGHEKVLLSSIKSLAFFSEEYTKARRSNPISQLTCKGKICDSYQPGAVQCVNIGGDGIDVNWKCEADLPSSLRFGKVTVSCEGWSRPGDEYVLKGSCGLEYTLVRVPKSFDAHRHVPSKPGTLKHLLSDPAALLFYAVLIYLAYLLFKSCIAAHREANRQARRAPGGGRGSNGGWSGWFGGSGGGASTPGRDPPPPYYPKQSPGNSNSAQEGSWTPGFWTGLGLGGLAGTLWNSRDDANPARRARERAEMPWQQEYDWERARAASSSSWYGTSNRYSTYTGTTDESDHAGSSSGEMRRSIAKGNSRVR